ncbi:hypothetical protein JCM10908_000047 [Rhodotorula pacifica]|uniref:uncharacterized protein n=1 Tax=Rhodotorula pacifica TaxID=1495444 RepID=UPI003177EDB3
MSDTQQALEAQLLALIAATPAGQNPWLTVKENLLARMFPRLPPSAFAQAYLLATLLGICGLFAIASLILRWKKGIAWVFRIRRDPVPLLCPHIVISWSIDFVLMVAFLEVYLALTLGYFHRHLNTTYAYWYFCVWFFPYLSGCVASWALAVSLVIHKQTITRGRYAKAVMACNIVGPGAPLIFAGILLGLAIPTGRTYSGVVQRNISIDKQLEARAATWHPGDLIVGADLAGIVPLLQQQRAMYKDFRKCFTRVYIFYAVAALLLVAILSAIAATYFLAMRNSLNATRRVSMSSMSTGSDKLAQGFTTQQHRVRRTLSNLLWTFFLFITLGLVFSISAIIAASNPDALITSPSSAQAVTFLPLYGFAILGIPCMALVFASAVRAAPAPESPRLGGITSAGSVDRSETTQSLLR